MRSLLVFLLLFYGAVAAVPPAFADAGAAIRPLDEGDHGDDGEEQPPPEDGEEKPPPGGGDEEKPPGEGEKPPSRGEGREYDEHYAFYGEIRLAGERVVAGSRRLLGPDPLLPYLAPGMWVEAEGRVEGSGLRVQRLRVLRPEVWAYYQGPGRALGLPGRVRVWFAGEGAERYRLQSLGGDGPEAVIVACFSGSRWRALPPALTPPFRASAPGWWRLSGAYYSYGLRVEKSERLGDCSP